MTDIVLVPVTSSTNVSAINSNFKKVQDSINKDVLQLFGGNNSLKQDIDLNGHNLLNVSVDVNKPSSLLTVGMADSRYYNIAGDSLTGQMDASNQHIVNLPMPSLPTEPVRKQEYDSSTSLTNAAVVANKASSIRAPDGESLSPLAGQSSRAGKLMSFDGSGQPVAIAAAAQSATALALLLADPNTGGANVSIKKRKGVSGTLQSATDEQLNTTFSFSAPASSQLVESTYTVALGGADSNAAFRIAVEASGATTATQPATGYVNAVDLTPDYVFMHSQTGWNQSTSTNDGRTGIYAHRVKMVQDGQGDLVAFNASIRVRTAKVGATHWLASPAAVLINGTLIGEVDGAYLNPRELFLTDMPAATSYNVTCFGDVINMNRNHVTDTQANGGIGQIWAAYRAQSVGTAAVDVILSANGKFFSGIDLSSSTLDFGTNKGAIAMKAGDRHYFNATSAQINDGTIFIRQGLRQTGGFADYTYYDGTALRWKAVVGGVEVLQVSNSQVTVPQINCTGIVLVGSQIQVAGSKVVGTRVTGYTAFTGANNTSTAYDSTTVTLPQLAARVAALQLALTTHGLIGT